MISARSPKDEECCGSLQMYIASQKYTAAQIILMSVFVECVSMLCLAHSLVGDEPVPLIKFHMLVTVNGTQYLNMHVFSMRVNGPKHGLPWCKAYLQPHTDFHDCLKHSTNMVNGHTHTTHANVMYG